MGVDLNTFLGSLSAVKPVPVSTERPAAVTSVDVYDGTSNVPVTSTDRDTTPNGIVVEYQAKPKRLYRVNGVTVPSVTTVLDVLNKGGLTIWGMRVGIQGVLTLFEKGRLCSAFDWDKECERIALQEGEYATVESVEALLKEEKLTTNDAKDSSADRGNIVHQALEDWAKTGKVPVASDFSDREEGYIDGLAKFLVDADPEPVRTEVMVGSVEHGFAGRYDLELRLSETRKLRKTPKQKWHDIEPGTFLVDCKSSKGVYPSTHFRQLAAYEAARVECGYEPTDGQYVLNVNGEGSYAFVRSTAVLEDFLAVLSVVTSDLRMKAAA